MPFCGHLYVHVHDHEIYIHKWDKLLSVLQHISNCWTRVVLVAPVDLLKLNFGHENPVLIKRRSATTADALTIAGEGKPLT